MIDNAGPRGAPDAVLLAHDFEPQLFADLVRAGLANARTEVSRADGQTVKVAHRDHAGRSTGANGRVIRCTVRGFPGRRSGRGFLLPG